MVAENVLYFGDNLEVLRRHVRDETVDLVYIDPPFNSKADYNVLFRERDGSRSAAQIQAFGDTWIWDEAAALAYRQTVERPGKVSEALQAFRQLIGDNDMLAYLSMMAPRLVELHRVLRGTGTLYVHCDETASHYLKLLLDAIFGAERFLSQITWKRTHSHGNVGRNFGAICDTILVYTKGPQYTWNQQYTTFTQEYIEATFDRRDPDGRRWQSVTLRNPGLRPNLHFPYTASNGVTYQPHPNGWSCDLERLQKYDREGRLHFPAKASGALRLKMYLDESPGVKLQNLWDDIPPIGSKAAERLGYPTQKPEALLERIIATSSNPGDVVLDAFCGCGTAIAAAQKLGRCWVGIDITRLAINLIRHRLADAFGTEAKFRVVGEPTTVQEARALADQDKYQFQWWALGLVGARPVASEQKKGADRGIDGRLFFHDEGPTGKTKQVILSVKGGHTDVSHVRDLWGVINREKAEIGVLISLQEPTQPMRSEAASADFYESAWGAHPRLQLLTIADILGGKGIDMPPLGQVNRTFRRAPVARAAGPAQPSLLDR